MSIVEYLTGDRVHRCSCESILRVSHSQQGLNQNTELGQSITLPKTVMEHSEHANKQLTFASTTKHREWEDFSGRQQPPRHTFLFCKNLQGRFAAEVC